MMQGDLCWDAIHPDCHLGTSLPTQPLRGHGAPDSDCAPQVLPRRARGSVEDACEFVGPMAMQLIESCIRERESPFWGAPHILHTLAITWHEPKAARVLLS